MTPRQQARRGIATKLLLGGVRAYRRLPRAAAGLRCRFYPSCSGYALAALEQYGAARGSLMTLRRLVRCHPFHPGGIDHVPSRAGELTAAEPAEPRQGASA